MTNTNWQSYSGEASVSYLSQMVGLTVQNFVSAATGLAVLVALCRGIARAAPRPGQLLGRHDPRHPLRPAAAVPVLALLLVWQGVPQTFADYAHA
jgi:K+-transporting ATPase ATPase A chain